MKTVVLIFFTLVTVVFADFIRDDSRDIVIDTSRTLMWQDDANVTISKNWSEAVTYCTELNNTAGSDWRLPNQNELRSVVDRNSTTSPTINIAFKYVKYDSATYYWSSSTYKADTTNAWVVTFRDGIDDWFDKSDINNMFFRCVRDCISNQCEED